MYATGDTSRRTWNRVTLASRARRSGVTLSTAERNILRGEVNALTAVVEGSDGTAADVANEILELLEENEIAVFVQTRDVTETQLP